MPNITSTFHSLNSILVSWRPTHPTGLRSETNSAVSLLHFHQRHSLKKVKLYNWKYSRSASECQNFNRLVFQTKSKQATVDWKNKTKHKTFFSPNKACESTTRSPAERPLKVAYCRNYLKRSVNFSINKMRYRCR